MIHIFMGAESGRSLQARYLNKKISFAYLFGYAYEAAFLIPHFQTR